ncbi:MAG: hypothetical protein LJE84_13670, partial [Gammaproteobacteria bacterium]|nr:hypothetical protein [Gammaproteobacteria bacterium]
MKKLFFPTLLAACLVSTPVFAADGTWFGDRDTPQGSWIVGVKGGTMNNENEGYDSASTRGFVLGYTFARPAGRTGGAASIEAEFTDTYSDGEINQDLFVGGTGTWNISTKALYVAYRTGGTVYFKGKAGTVLGDLEETPTGGESVADDKLKFSFGGGLG